MRTIRRTAAFKRDYKREKRGRFRKTLDAEPKRVIIELSADRPLDPRNRDHSLAGPWKDHRDCHIRPDLVLIYRKPDSVHLDLIRLGSHSELGLLSDCNFRCNSGPDCRVEKSMAVVIDGVMYQDDLTAPIPEGAEVYLPPRIGGG